ncbi:hypothetical protein B0H14DRAFT_2643679 [Mycena olivaceomarginata]|nr:hypothetical protein B0H14DRAFT_2643679 [Mycena olivaceomarginata]
MLPSLKPGDRKAHVMGYPGEFIQPKPHKEKFNEYKFRWLNCDGGVVFHSSLSDLLAPMLDTHFGSRKFLEAFRDVTLTAKMGNTRQSERDDEDNPDDGERADVEMLGAMAVSVEALGTRYPQLNYGDNAWSGQAVLANPLAKSAITANNKSLGIKQCTLSGWLTAIHQGSKNHENYMETGI